MKSVQVASQQLSEFVEVPGKTQLSEFVEVPGKTESDKAD